MLRVLVVESDEDIRRAIREELSPEFNIFETDDPAEALGLALRSAPDCILVDLSMHRFEGLELCHTLCSMSHTRMIPVFVIVSDDAPDSREFWLNLGVRDVFRKPPDYRRLKEAVHGVCKKPAPQKPGEVQVQLKVVLKLSGISESGRAFETLTATDQVSANGFQCRFTVPVEAGSIVDVCHVHSSGERRVGRARVLDTEWGGMPWQTCRFQFTEKSSPWIV